MFDIGFWELSIIMVVALLVIGPERLPGLARKAGLYLGKARRFVSSVKNDINQELKAEELKRILQEQKDSTGLHEIVEETKKSISQAKQDYLVKSPETNQSPGTDKPEIKSDNNERSGQ
jgi:sec-independent protein translocase protein TatB